MMDTKSETVGMLHINEFFSFFLNADPATFNDVWGSGMGEHLWRKFNRDNKGDVRKFWSDLDSVCRTALAKHLWA